ncbi:hypothetical protein CIW82_12050 [Acetobacter tropicalis]|uniref:Uncharacterized protein n=3 Tax=Acetobacter TaxID=434 RepID=A0A291PIV2_9PROT|nr:hypothetical protein CIW82_12050 [Acetobacter tropicalis]
MLLAFTPFQLHAQSPSNDLKTTNIIFQKKSKNFNIKNFFPLLDFQKNSYLSLRKIDGYYFISNPLEKKRNNNASSETLFSIMVSKNGKCPKEKEASENYISIYSKYSTSGVGATILKQNTSGKTSFPFTYNFVTPLSIKVSEGSCVFLGIDGSNFSTDNYYTMGAHINISYKLLEYPEKKSSLLGLDGEFTLSVNNENKSTLNAYVVIPISKNGPFFPNKIINIFGNASATPRIRNHTLEKSKNNWHIVHIISVYTKNSCQIAFPKHKNRKFFWNDKTGTKWENKTSSVFWPSSKILSTLILGEGDYRSSQKQVNKNFLPVITQDGDCIVDAIIPIGTEEETPPINTESQLYLQTTQ